MKHRLTVTGQIDIQLVVVQRYSNAMLMFLEMPNAMVHVVILRSTRHLAIVPM
jgi:hypothetical protein